MTQFSLNDLAAYYVRRLEPHYHREEDVKQILHWLVNNGHTVSLLLHAIDIWRIEDSEEGRGSDPWQVTRYLPEARKELAWREIGLAAMQTCGLVPDATPERP